MTPTRRLRAVHPSSTPVLIDPPGLADEHASDEWRDGWQACRATLSAEWEAWYKRGLNAQPVQSFPGVLLLGIGACSGFIGGFIVAVVAFA